ncbi:hypothetical protein [uncultured Nitratireductor sp.]|uniref:hypothetical protein n=1 Tax=uncultured Nitratireductor sp. TaxID=520953 RepID=UPI0025E4739D|nr:hypothetical protein [uncultured Nitratireductor sp.]
MAPRENDGQDENDVPDSLNLQAIFGAASIASALEKQQETLSRIEGYDPLHLASCFVGY